MTTLVDEVDEVDEVGDEREALLTFIDAQRGALRRAVRGLTEEQAAATPTASTLSLAGLIKHNTEAERVWIVGILDGRMDDIVKRDQSNRAEAFRMVKGETVAGLLQAWEAAEQETKEIVRALPDLDVAVPLPERPWFPAGSKRSARWILLHLIQEMSRHAGHADIIRETLDGKSALELAQEAQG
jgi:uncharacterized damage-inducible protein DinB